MLAKSFVEAASRIIAFSQLQDAPSLEKGFHKTYNR